MNIFEPEPDPETPIVSIDDVLATLEEQKRQEEFFLERVAGIPFHDGPIDWNAHYQRPAFDVEAFRREYLNTFEGTLAAPSMMPITQRHEPIDHSLDAVKYRFDLDIGVRRPSGFAARLSQV